MAVTPVNPKYKAGFYPDNPSPKISTPKFVFSAPAPSSASPLLNVTDLTGSLPVIDSPIFQRPKKEEESKIPPSKETTVTHNKATKALTLDEYQKEELEIFSPDEFVINELREDSFRLYDNLEKLAAVVDPALLDLRICRCGRISPQQRAQLENAAIDAIKAQHAPDTCIKIVSVGSGGCYQELVYLSRLAKAGYWNFQLVLIEPQKVPLESLRAVCLKYLPKCNFQAVHYPSLESYKQNASQKKPSLLLLLDLTEEKYYINKNPLPDHCFKLFHDNQLMENNTVIVWNVVKDNRDPNETVLSVGWCGLYDNTEENLYDLSKKKKVGSCEVVGRSELPPYKRVIPK